MGSQIRKDEHDTYHWTGVIDHGYCDEAGQTKTMAVERIVAAFLDERDAKKDGGKQNNGNDK